MMSPLLPYTTLTVSESIGYGTILHVGLSLVVILHLLSKPRDARTSLLWIFFTTAFPIVGPLGYLLFGINTIPQKGWKKQFSDQSFLEHLQSEEREEAQVGIHFHRKAYPGRLTDPVSAQIDHILAHLSPDHPLSDGNGIQIFARGDQAIATMFAALRTARQHIHLSTYIFSDDETGKALMSILVERANAGVSVRVLYDAFGSAGPSLRLFFWKYRKIRNLQLIGFSQANIFKRKFQLNLRNHRKILVVDGHVAFIGGVNFHDAYTANGKRLGIIDYHFEVKGPIVSELQYTFLRDWYYMTDIAVEHLLSALYFPRMERSGSMVVRIQNSGPTRDESEAALRTFFAMINLARQQILLVTPYFVPPDPLILALQHAAFRGVDVKIIVPSENNHPTLRLASQALYTRLLTAGVRIFERKPPFIHAKAAVIDNRVALIGSANIDPRSLSLNYETNLVVFDESFANQLKQIIQDDLAQSNEIQYAEWRRRSKVHQLAENFFNLFHPIA